MVMKPTLICILALTVSSVGFSQIPKEAEDGWNKLCQQVEYQFDVMEVIHDENEIRGAVPKDVELVFPLTGHRSFDCTLSQRQYVVEWQGRSADPSVNEVGQQFAFDGKKIRTLMFTEDGATGGVTRLEKGCLNGYVVPISLAHYPAEQLQFFARISKVTTNEELFEGNRCLRITFESKGSSDVVQTVILDSRAQLCTSISWIRISWQVGKRDGVFLRNSRRSPSTPRLHRSQVQHRRRGC